MSTPLAPNSLAASALVLPDVECVPSRARFREAYTGIELYTGSGDARAAVDLSDNTNLWGAPPAAVEAMRAAIVAAPRYPTVYATELCEALATRFGVTSDMIVTGCGSDDVLDAAMRALAESGDTVAMPDPTFPMAATFARMNGLEPIRVPLTSDHQPDVDALLETRARITYIASPNNPTGLACPITSLARLAADVAGVLIVDAAYADYCPLYRESLARLIARSDRVLIVQTLSKAWGLAGLRIGYAAAPPALAREVAKARGPYKVSTLAERAATAALRHDAPWVAARAGEAIVNRERLVEELRARGLTPLRSDANFVLLPLADWPGGAAAFTAALRAHDVGVRPYSGLPGLGDAVRITIGPWPLIQRLLDACDAVLGAGCS
jgi:histidinol-phosphate aminotransferase